MTSALLLLAIPLAGLMLCLGITADAYRPLTHRSATCAQNLAAVT